MGILFIQYLCALNKYKTMKQVITEKDINSLLGKFVVQLDARDDEPDYTARFRSNPGFWLEKRITFIGQLCSCDGYPAIKRDEENTTLIINNGFYYTHGVFSKEEFVTYFNHYITKEVGGKDRTDARYHRLLTNKELDWLNEELKKQK